MSGPVFSLPHLTSACSLMQVVIPPGWTGSYIAFAELRNDVNICKVLMSSVDLTESLSNAISKVVGYS